METVKFKKTSAGGSVQYNNQPAMVFAGDVTIEASGIGWGFTITSEGRSHRVKTEGFQVQVNDVVFTGTEAQLLTKVKDEVFFLKGTADQTDISKSSAIAAWGDSLTNSSFVAEVKKVFGQHVWHGGVGGETSVQIKARMLPATTKHVFPTIIWAGRNNYTDVSIVKADIAEMVAKLGHSNYLVISILNGNYAGEFKGGANYAIMMGLNADLAATYGPRFVDVRSYLVSKYNPGIPQDVTDFNNDTVPSSLRTDNIHLTSAAYVHVLDKIKTAAAYLIPPSVPIGTETVPVLAQFLPVLKTGYAVNNATTDPAGLTGPQTVATGTIKGRSASENGGFVFIALFRFTNNTNTKSFQVNFNGTAVWRNGLSIAANSYLCMGFLMNRGAYNSQVSSALGSGQGASPGQTSGGTSSTFTIATDEDVAVAVQIDKTVGTDQAWLEYLKILTF